MCYSVISSYIILKLCMNIFMYISHVGGSGYNFGNVVLCVVYIHLGCFVLRKAIITFEALFFKLCTYTC